MLKTYLREPRHPACAVMIWLHGLGADAQDMMGLVDALPLTSSIRHLFLDAPVRAVTLNQHMPMRAWYDILGLDVATRQDSEGILESEAHIRAIIDQQVAQGIPAQHIFLAGFSQGGAMALFTGLHYPLPLGGIIALSAYLPLVSHLNELTPSQETNIFMAAGTFDPVIPISWSQQSCDWLKTKNIQQLSFHHYPMEHSVCNEELQDLALWIEARLLNLTSGHGEHV